MNQRLIKHMLEKFDCCVDVAANGEEALALVTREALRGLVDRWIDKISQGRKQTAT